MGYRRWASQLHGGQLVIVLLAWSGLVVFLFALGNSYDGDYTVYSDRARRLADSAGVFADLYPEIAKVTESATSAGNTGLVLSLAALLLLPMPIATLWWWLGARKR